LSFGGPWISLPRPSPSFMVWRTGVGKICLLCQLLRDNLAAIQPVMATPPFNRSYRFLGRKPLQTVHSAKCVPLTIGGAH
jgi:hypothetical protein